MKILITNVYAKGSGGDMAILGSLIYELRRVFPGAQVSVATIDDPKNLNSLFPDVHCISSLITTVWKDDAGQISKLLSLLRTRISTGMWALCFRFLGKRPDLILKRSERESMNCIADADLVVGVGGGYVREDKGILKIIDLSLTLRMIVLSRLMGKTTVLHSQSVGPFGNRIQERLAAFVLNRLQLVLTRESVSRQVLKRIGVKDKIIVESVDAAFLVRGQNLEPLPLPDEIEGVGRNESSPLVGVTARAWLGKESQDRFERELAKSLDWISERYGARILFIPQTTVDRHTDDDRIVQKRIMEYMQHKDRAIFMKGAYDYKTLLQVYSNLDFIIGTRFHSAIFSLTAEVPALVVAYEHKAIGIMEDLGLGEWVIRIEDVDTLTLDDKFEKLFENREKYIQQLRRVLPDYTRRAQKSVETIKDTYLALEGLEELPAINDHEAEAHESLSK